MAWPCLSTAPALVTNFCLQMTTDKPFLSEGSHISKVNSLKYISKVGRFKLWLIRMHHLAAAGPSDVCLTLNDLSFLFNLVSYYLELMFV